MSEVRRRVGRAFRDHGSFERRGEETFESVTTPFEATVEVASAGEGQVGLRVRVRVPMLSHVVEDHVADVVAEGWFETFELRVTDVGGITRGDHDLSPTVHRDGGKAIVEATLEDIDERRAVDDAGSLINFVEGTYAQGIIPGYEYTEPASQLIERARQTGKSA